MKLIIIQGAPATGKTRLAKRLAEDLGCELFSKDGYKEAKFDELNRVPTYREWVELEIEGAKKLHEAVAKQSKNSTFIVESNFRTRDKIALQKLIDNTDSVYEVFLYVRGTTSIKRYYKRNKRGEWHKGHKAATIGYPIVTWINFLSLIRRPIHKPLELSEHTLKIDTTDFSKVDYDEILEFVKS